MDKMKILNILMPRSPMRTDDKLFYINDLVNFIPRLAEDRVLQLVIKTD